MTIKEQAFAWVDSHKENIISLWKDMVDIDSAIGAKEEGMKIGNLCAARLEKLGFKIHRYSFEECGDTIVGVRGNLEEGKWIFLNGHIDICFAPGDVAKRPFTIKDGKAYGPGVLDMKGGDTICLSALEALYDAGYDFPCKVMFVADEEPAHKFSNNPELIMKEAAGAKCGFVFETGFMDCSITVQRKGCWRFFLDTWGRGCHVGNDPENGRNAILEMAYKIIEIEKLSKIPEYNINVGTIEGGTVANAAPAHCRVEVDFRYISEDQLAYMRGKIDEIVKMNFVPDVTTTFAEAVGFLPMTRLDSTMKMLEVAKEVSRENGWPEPAPRLCGGASDAAYTTKMGVPTLCSIGVQGARNHTVEEWADVESMFYRTKLLIAMLLKLNQDDVVLK